MKCALLPVFFLFRSNILNLVKIVQTTDDYGRRPMAIGSLIDLFVSGQNFDNFFGFLIENLPV